MYLVEMVTRVLTRVHGAGYPMATSTICSGYLWREKVGSSPVIWLQPRCMYCRNFIRWVCQLVTLQLVIITAGLKVLGALICLIVSVLKFVLLNRRRCFTCLFVCLSVCPCSQLTITLVTLLTTNSVISNSLIYLTFLYTEFLLSYNTFYTFYESRLYIEHTCNFKVPLRSC